MLEVEVGVAILELAHQEAQVAGVRAVVAQEQLQLLELLIPAVVAVAVAAQQAVLLVRLEALE
jgi:hypothetical protein